MTTYFIHLIWEIHKYNIPIHVYSLTDENEYETMTGAG